MLEGLKETVWQANLGLQKQGLVLFTWGNASGIDRNSGLVVIKPSGVDYEKLRPEDMAVLDLEGKQVEGNLRPSSDAPTHLELYRHFSNIGGIVHTHSTYATVWAQAGKAIPALGTTHADYFYGGVLCTRCLKEQEIAGQYEHETGKVIVETLCGLNPCHVPGILVSNHGPFSWGRDAHEAVYHATVLEEVAKMAVYTYALNPQIQAIDQVLLDKHFLRKHGSKAYYGQESLDECPSRITAEKERGDL
ncbi:MAG: L-ribulose-5-phosphate 4-epimerase [Firmicutes bacterium]|nr:L-ribulose-5-phosphate 4-epimerase [Bacillota bacterium]